MSDRKKCLMSSCLKYAYHGYRYCVDCGGRVRAEMEKGKFLTDDREYKTYRPAEARENIAETKRGR